MRLFLGNDANHHKFIDIQRIDVPRATDDACNDICERCFAQYVDRTVECIPMGLKRFGGSVDFIETCAKLFGRKRYVMRV